jgi:hypothetical protein
MLGLAPIFIKAGIAFIAGFIIVMLIKGGIQWRKNNNSPVLTVGVKVVAKRMAVSRHLPPHHHGHGMPMNHATSTSTYFVTFEAETGDRLELGVPDKEYGMLVEGDTGKLTFQGTRYKGFERERGK